MVKVTVYKEGKGQLLDRNMKVIPQVGDILNIDISRIDRQLVTQVEHDFHGGGHRVSIRVVDIED